MPWHDPSAHYSWYESGRQQELGFADFNADGRPEWLVGFGGSAYGGTHHGEMQLLQWIEQGFVSLLTLEYFEDCIFVMAEACYEATWQFANLDQDEAQEVVIAVWVGDPWGCPPEQQIFDWDGVIYVEQPSQNNPSAECLMSDAELNMQRDGFAEAIPAYEALLELEVVQNPELRQYAQARLMIAYSLSGQTAATQTLLEELQSQTPASEFLESLVDALSSSDPSDEVSVCVAANIVIQHCVDRYGTLSEMPTTLPLGQSVLSDADPSNPFTAGCDVINLLIRLYSHNPQRVNDFLMQYPQFQEAFEQRRQNVLRNQQPTPTHPPVPTMEAAYETGVQAFVAGDYATALNAFEQAIASMPPDQAASVQLGLHYWRALTLEAMNRPEEALQDYLVVLNGSIAGVDLNAEYLDGWNLPPEWIWYEIAAQHVDVDPPIELPVIVIG